MRRDEAVYFHHILDAIERIEEYLLGVDEEAFYQQNLIQDGVIRQLEIIGEATKQNEIQQAKGRQGNDG